MKSREMKNPFMTTMLALVLVALMLLSSPAPMVFAANENKQPASGAAQNPCTQHVAFQGIEFDIPPYYTSLIGYDKMVHGWCDSDNLFFVLEDGSSATNGYSYLHVGVSDLTMTAGEYEEAMPDTQEFILGCCTDAALSQAYTGTIAGLPAMEIQYTYTEPSTGVLMEADTVVFYHEGSGKEYSFTYAESPDTYFDGWSDYFAVIASIYLSENPPERETPVTGDTIRPEFTELMKPYEDFITTLGEEYEDLDALEIGYYAVQYFGYLKYLNEDYNYYMSNYGATHAETAYYNTIRDQYVDIGIRAGLTSAFTLFGE